MERYQLPYTAEEVEIKLSKMDTAESTDRKVDEITSDIKAKSYPTVQAVVDYIDENVITYVNNKAAADKTNILNEARQVPADYNENDKSSKAYIQNRPFYELSASGPVTETFYSSSEGDPTANYVFDTDSSRVSCAPLATIPGLGKYFSEGATLDFALGYVYKGAGGSNKSYTMEKSSTV